MFARNAVQAGTHVLPRSALPTLCSHCGGPLIPALARIVRLPRHHRRRQQAQLAFKPAGARQAHTVALVTPCSLCDVEHVRRFRTPAAARQANPQAKEALRCSEHRAAAGCYPGRYAGRYRCSVAGC
ncbi:hypothetical protein WJX81_002963 [Elliptochloris bilobata]|uniref:Uncharacterized protein n=1 Tax=Elliptochloris bilobata TaxID=381761 RepID=A0AAW1QV84_9CHLO